MLEFSGDSYEGVIIILCMLYGVDCLNVTVFFTVTLYVGCTEYRYQMVVQIGGLYAFSSGGKTFVDFSVKTQWFVYFEGF